ncbi:kinase-like domain-containing protein [Rhizophagus irregularis DAOM 181602=DAOM 197198]|uniref:Tpk2p n=1 Tax=Rhizophagus irregularis (strain DAOM 197198w) TaxID=1432141 RepID=A0A015KYC1_RHIIW|nr:Tpk2p [Rhizophagus irregularis DAOM 197198w]GBC21855.1 kinase-like domain-containing protein [Rhizophagus irregularis DAOM 181602=DAOM 197198]
MNLTSWTSGNEKIDDFIQERQLKLKFDNYDDIIFEWIPYNQFNEIKETEKNKLITLYSAIWKDGPLIKNQSLGVSYHTRDSNKVVSLKCLHNLKESIDSLINEAKKYPTKHNAFQALYGISQNPGAEDYILVQNNYLWISGNKKIDDFIQESQLKINNYNDIVLEWIPYNQFNEIKEIGKNKLITVYSAIWKGGPLHRKNQQDKNYTRDSNKVVSLKCLHNLKESIDSLMNEAKKYPTEHNKFQALYGISQNPNIMDYILVQNNFMNLTSWTSGNEKIDDFIQERQLKLRFDNYDDIVLEWIPYNQFNEIKETEKNKLITLYSAIWKDGPLYYYNNKYKYTRDSNKEVALKYLHDPQNSVDSLINEAEKYSTKYKAFQALYGISKNPDTEQYIFVQKNSINLTNWISGNEKIDDFIQEMQLKFNDKHYTIFEWIPYNQLSKIKEIGKNGPITIYSAIWKDGPLYCNNKYKYTRDSNKEVALKYLHDSQNSVDSLINEVKKYLSKKILDRVICNIYGISQNPNTKNYILILAWASGNEKIDDLIQEIQLQINNHSDKVFEWISYNQFNNIKEIDKGGFATVYSANWKDGPLEYNTANEVYKRNPNRVIALKCLHNSQNITNKFLNEVKEYSINKRSNILNVHGISQNPDTKEYIMVLQYAKEGNFNHWINKNYEYFNWKNKLSALLDIINGLKEIHQKNIVHCDIHTGNILFLNNINVFGNCISISDMGLCGEVGNIDETKIYGVMPYVAPEVLRRKPYTQESDIYSFGMIMYFVATGRQPFYNRAHDKLLALDICEGVRPEIDELEAPSCYIDLIKKCLDLNPNNRPNSFKVKELIMSFHKSYGRDFFIVENEDIEMQFKKAEEYRKANLSIIKNYQITTHSQAIYTSRLLNPFTEDLPEYDDNSQCLDQAI